MIGFEEKAEIKDLAPSTYTSRVVVLRNYAFVIKSNIDALFRAAAKNLVR